MTYLDLDALKAGAKSFGIDITEKQGELFEQYAKILVEYNEKVNLTAIIDPTEIAHKHFVDSIIPLTFMEIKEGATVCDIGSGAGFPAVPFKIIRPDLKITMMDSLGKRVTFQKHLLENLGLGCNCLHMRAEEAARKDQYREKYDIVTARAVARLQVLSEYCLPLTKLGGTFIAMKGQDAKGEFEVAETAIKTLGGKNSLEKSYLLSDGESHRTIFYIEKIAKTNPKYPRNSGIIAKKPL